MLLELFIHTALFSPNIYLCSTDGRDVDFHDMSVQIVIWLSEFADGWLYGGKKHKLESRLPGEISITSDMQMTPPLWQKVKRN